MRNLLKIFASLIIAAAVASGCQKDEPVNSGKSVVITLDVKSGNMTKATEAPTAEEAKIHSIRVYAYSGQTLVGHYFKSMASPVSEHSLAMDITIVGVDDVANNAQTVDLYVIANEESMTLTGDVTSFSENLLQGDLWTVRYSAVDPSKGLPMYYTGAHAIKAEVDTPLTPDPSTDMTGHEDHQIAQKLSVSLVRPVAKMELYVAKEAAASSLTVNSATVSNPATVGFLLPPNALTGITLSATPLTFVPSAVTVTKVLDPTVAGIDLSDHNNYQLVGTTHYLLENPDGSEVWNVQSSANGSVLDFRFTEDGTDEAEVAYLPKIERNTSYKICCLIRSDREVVVRFEVSEWNEETVNVPEYN